MNRTFLIGTLLLCSACGTGEGESTVCRQPSPPCEVQHGSAVELFSRRGCEGAISSYWCGVNAQELAQCLHDAQICLKLGTTREQMKAALTASECAEQFEAWDTCFANGEAEGDGFDDD